MGAYRRLLALPDVRPILAANLLSRLDIGMTTLTLVLFLRARTGSFAVAGAVAGAYGLGLGLMSPFVSRRVDRRGVGALAGLAGLHSVGLVALIVLGRANAAAGVLVLTGLATGVCVPPTSAVLRAQWPRLTAGAPELLTTAFALEAVMIEAIFTTGPLIVALVVLLATPEVALGIAAATSLAGTLWFMRRIPAHVPAAADAPKTHWLGALTSPGIRTIVAAMFPVGAAFGLIEVALPALARSKGRPELAGLLLSVWSAASALSGIAWGARARTMSLGRAHTILACLLPLGFLPVLLSPSAPAAALLIPAAGVTIAPLIATRNELAGAVAPAGVATEAFTWPTTSLVAGLSAGNAVAGALADGPGWRAAVLVAVGTAALGALVTTARRASLEPPATVPACPPPR